jgi:glutathione S-transferase
VSRNARADRSIPFWTKEADMKLYYAPSACSLSPHIALREAGATFTLEKVDTRAKTTASGRDFKSINPKGYVPALELDDGEVLTEGVAIVQYIADHHPQAKLAPPAGSLERYRLQEWLNFVATELHKGFSPLFRPNTPDAYKDIAKQNLAARFDWLSQALEGRDYLMGSQFSVADGYLFVILRWAQSKYGGFDLARWPSLKAWFERMSARPAVQAALAAEQ